jgi:dihydrofolate synthase/folylpolyglutamate synthase
MIRLGLDRVRRALELLGHPEDAFASVLIAGTNGKGSVSAMTESVLRRAGYRTGLFTSPHLVDVRERIRVDGRWIPRRSLTENLGRVMDISKQRRLSLTEFEAQTLAAFLHFQKEKVEIAVVEVGLGGRLDATNALPSPEVTVITSIGHDHMDWLGPTLAHIYREKFGIARPGTPLLQAIPASLESLSRRFCEERAVPVWTLGKDLSHSKAKTNWRRGSQTLDVEIAGKHFHSLQISLIGHHQRDNAALAVGVVERLRRSGWKISDRHLREGLARARWPGRFQILAGRRPVVLDGAHNPEGVRSLVSAYRMSPWKDATAVLIFGCLKDKDAAAMVQGLRPLAHRALVIPLPTARGRSPKELAGLWRRHTPTAVCPDFKTAWREAGRETGPVLVTGSLYLVGEALKTL